MTATKLKKRKCRRSSKAAPMYILAETPGSDLTEAPGSDKKRGRRKRKK